MKDYLGHKVEGTSKRRGDGFAVEALGRQGAAVFSLLILSTVPRSMAFCVWLGLAVSSSLKPEDLGLDRSSFAVLVVALVCAGLGSLFADLKSMLAQGQE